MSVQADVGAQAPVVVQGLTKSYGDVRAVDDVTMVVPRGSVFGLLGPNGAGKSTLVKLLLGLARPTYGRGFVLGAPLGTPSVRRRIGYLPELFRFPAWLSGREVLAFHARLLGLPRRQLPAESERVLTEAGLLDHAERPVGTYSKGMQQRLGLAVALLGRPELLFLDEPTSALDPVGRHDVRLLVQRQKEEGATVLLNSHLLSEVEQTCDHVAILKGGRVLQTGPLAELLGRTGVRLRLERWDEALLRALFPDCEQRHEGPWLVLLGPREAEIPDIVAKAVAAGLRVQAVLPLRETLEERFLDLLHQP